MILLMIIIVFTYNNNRKVGAEHCIYDERNVTSKLPPFFDWLKLATYEGQRIIREIKYDFWGLTVSLNIQIIERHDQLLSCSDFKGC